MKAYVGCVGCEQRQMDSERVRTYLQMNGFTLVEKAAASDFCVLVTCAVDERNEAASVEALHYLVSIIEPQTRLVVGGCLPSISPQQMIGIRVAGTFSPRTMEDLDNFLGVDVRVSMSEIKDPNKSVYDGVTVMGGGQPSAREEYDRAKRGFKIRVNHGCLLNCTYCVIVKATGRLQSVPREEVVASFRDAVQRLEPSIMLMGGDTGAYGLDDGSNFADLLDELLTIQGAHRVFIHDFNVNWLLRDMPNYMRILLKRSQRLRGICLPIQSGSDNVLKRMKRPYKADEVMHALRWIRVNAPNIRLGTHMIAGFPGETDEDFNQSLSLLREIGFDFVTCFRYSEHPEAPSARLEPKVPEQTKLARLGRFRTLLGERANILL